MNTTRLPSSRSLFSALTLGLALALAACQQAPTAPGAAPPPGNPKLGGMRPGETYTVVDCPVMNGTKTTCTIPLEVIPPASGIGSQCTVNLANAASLPKSLTQLQWKAAPPNGSTFEVRFRHALPDGQGPFGVDLTDDLVYAPASNATIPMADIWVPVPPGTDRTLVQFNRNHNLRTWPPRISAYDIFLEYRASGARDWTSCDTWDPIIISRD